MSVVCAYEKEDIFESLESFVGMGCTSRERLEQLVRITDPSLDPRDTVDEFIHRRQFPRRKKKAKEILAGTNSVCETPRKRTPFDPIMIIAYPIMIIQGICAAIFLGVFHVAAAISDWLKGR